MEEIVNRVTDSGIKTIDLEKWKPSGNRSEIDLKDLLYQGLVLRENEFRQFIKDTDWDKYKGHFVNVYCSADAIVPNWAYMLISSKLSQVADKIVFGDRNELESHLILSEISSRDLSEFEGERVIIKGCSDSVIGERAYLEITLKLTPLVKSLMFGEPCSSVPIYKKK